MILAARFGCELDALGFTEKLKRFEKLNSRSQRVTTNTIHISLNFSPFDKIDTEKMQAIAIDYMKRIGFGDQPFLVYRHMDTAHPHIHIVASVIKPNGRPINLHNIGKLASEPARKTIEQEFGLIEAESMKKEIRQHEAKETKQSITNIVNDVIRSYHFANLEEFNLILRQHLVMADPGRLGSRLYLNKGLLYSNCDHDGNKIGISIKASSLSNKPTLKVLEGKFEKERNNKQAYSAHATRVLHEIIHQPGRLTETQFKRLLAKEKIRCYLEKNDNGTITDVKFVDNLNNVVLQCSDLHLPAVALLDKIIPLPRNMERNTFSPIHNKKQESAHLAVDLPDMAIKLIETLTRQEYDQGGHISPISKKKKKRRKPGF